MPKLEGYPDPTKQSESLTVSSLTPEQIELGQEILKAMRALENVSMQTGPYRFLRDRIRKGLEAAVLLGATLGATRAVHLLMEQEYSEPELNRQLPLPIEEIPSIYEQGQITIH